LPSCHVCDTGRSLQATEHREAHVVIVVTGTLSFSV